MKPPVSSSRDVLERMLARVEEMRRALAETAGAVDEGDVDVARATAALDDLERRVRRMLEHLGTLLRGAVADPRQAVTRLPWLTEDVRRRVLVDFNPRAAAEVRPQRGRQDRKRAVQLLHDRHRAAGHRPPE